jgi:hypothetical protein
MFLNRGLYRGANEIDLVSWRSAACGIYGSTNAAGMVLRAPLSGFFGLNGDKLRPRDACRGWPKQCVACLGALDLFLTFIKARLRRRLSVPSKSSALHTGPSGVQPGHIGGSVFLEHIDRNTATLAIWNAM